LDDEASSSRSRRPSRQGSKGLQIGAPRADNDGYRAALIELDPKGLHAYALPRSHVKASRKNDDSNRLLGIISVSVPSSLYIYSMHVTCDRNIHRDGITSLNSQRDTEVRVLRSANKIGRADLNELTKYLDDERELDVNFLLGQLDPFVLSPPAPSARSYPCGTCGLVLDPLSAARFKMPPAALMRILITQSRAYSRLADVTWPSGLSEKRLPLRKWHRSLEIERSFRFLEQLKNSITILDNVMHTRRSIFLTKLFIASIIFIMYTNSLKCFKNYQYN
jgi:hypothetical protein